MNSKNFCFITCVDDAALFLEAQYHIAQLLVPDGYETECIAVENAVSMACGYNQAMESTEAKYKIYLRQDACILNRNFLNDILTIFQESPEIGLLGVVGAEVISTSGIWWESKNRYGKVYSALPDNKELIAFGEVMSAYKSVAAIDGLIMITQYDLEWRADLFDGWHFYDMSQSVEFAKSGYKVAVPRQDKPWVCCGRSITGSFIREDYREVFLEEYSKTIFPLVSILIPTYNRPEYFKLALDSAINQTYRNIEIIVGDDSTDNRTELLIKRDYLPRLKNVVYYHNENNLGQFENDLKLFAMARGEYINYLMDDDLFGHLKVEKMMNYFTNDDKKEISLVTSYRAIINDVGAETGIFGHPEGLFSKDQLLSGPELTKLVLQWNYNCIGEPTTVLFRKSALTEPFGTFDRRKYGCNVDQAAWFNLLEHGKAVFMAEILSCFRIHSGQQQTSDRMKVLGATDYACAVLSAINKGLFSIEDQKVILRSCKVYCEMVMNSIEKSNVRNQHKIECAEFEDSYNRLVSQCESP